MQKGPHVSHYGFDVVLKADLLHLTNKGTFSVITCHSTRASVTIYCVFSCTVGRTNSEHAAQCGFFSSGSVCSHTEAEN